MSHLRITIDSDLEELYLVSLVLRAVCGHLALDEIQSSEVELCAIEAVTNAIRHAYGGQPGHDVSLRLSFTERQLDVEVCDSGLSMPLKYQENLRNGWPVFAFNPADQANLPPGGMGLEIIRQTMDRTEYTSQHGQKRFCMTKVLRKGART